MSSEAENVTGLLGELRNGNREAFERLFEKVYHELSKIARFQLQKERQAHTLDTIALIHEAYLKIADYRNTDWQSKAHFYAVAAQAMRQILVSYARHRNAEKRGGKKVSVTFDEALHVQTGLDDLVSLDEALAKLEVINERHVRIIECRYFAGLTIEETAESLGISTMTVSRDWRMARAWLKDSLADTTKQ